MMRSVIRAFVTCSLITLCAIATRADEPRLMPATTRTSSTLPTAQTVVDRYLAVTGGAAAHASITSRHATGVYEMPDLGLQGTLDEINRADGSAVLAIDLPSIGTIREGVTPDGTAWIIHPIDGPRLLRGDEAAGLRQSLALEPDTSLSGYASAEVVDVILVNGRSTWRMDLLDRAGAREQRFYDVESSLLVRTLATTPPPRKPTTAPADAQPITVATFFNDYSDVPPIRMPLRVRQSASGLSPEVILKRVEHNIDLPDARFALPPEIAALKKK